MRIRYLGIFFIIILTAGCGEGYKYNKLVESELAKGVRHDSLFLGIYLGMPKKEFYLHCWKLNTHGIIKQGSGNTTVYYKMADLDDTVEVNFYPLFYKDSIWRVPVRFNYLGWAPWRKDLYSDSLEVSLVNKFSEWYGKGFHKVLNKDKQPAYYKIDGNRQITIFKQHGDTYVWAVYTDLNIMKKVGKQKKEKPDSTTANIKPAMYN